MRETSVMQSLLEEFPANLIREISSKNRERKPRSRERTCTVGKRCILARLFGLRTDRAARKRASRAGTPRRNRQAIDDDPRHRCHLRNRYGGPCAAAGKLCKGARLRGLARSHATAKLFWRQDSLGRNLENGPARSAPAPCQGRDDGRSMGFAQGSARGILARAHDEEKASLGRCGGAREPHSADRLGLDDEGQGLQSFGRDPRARR